MDLFKLRREASRSDADSDGSLESLFSIQAPPALTSNNEAAGSPATAAFIGSAMSQELSQLPQGHALGSGSVVSEGSEINGVIKSSANLRVDGKFDGEIHVRMLVIGPSGMVSGHCYCESLLLMGRFKGEIECREIQINAGAWVDGSVGYVVMRAERGAELTGKFLAKSSWAPKT